MTWKKRIISIVLCLCALLCAASVRADAADHTDHPICGTTCNHTGENHSTGFSWQAWDGTGEITYTNNVAYVYLSDDVTLQINDDVWSKPKSLDVGNGKTLYLCLNGHSLTNRGSNTICVYGTLVLCDCKGGGQNNGTITHTKDKDGSFTGSEGIYVDSGAAFTMYGGTISGNNGGVQVYESTFTMYGGKISGNADRGVDVNGGTFTMYGGKISDNTFIDSPTSNFGGGAGVRVRDSNTVQGNFAMYGGEISNNTYKGGGDGGGVYARGKGDFIIRGGTITGNQCSYNGTTTSVTAFGGGLYITDQHKTLEISNNTVISNNTCDGNGGGIFIINNVTGSITNCTISNNSATGASSKGGGLAFDTATVTITGGSITDNKTMGKGGGMAVGSWGEDSKITLSGSMNFSGNAQGCTADENGKLTGGTANDVHLNTSSVYLRLADDFSKTSTAIVVTTASEPNNRSTVKIAEGSASVAKATDFTYGTDSNSAIGIIAKTKADGTTVELLAHKHNYSQKTDSDNHWQECSICKDIKGVTAHSGGEASCTKKAVCRVCNQPYGKLAAHVYDMTTWVKIDNDHHGHKCNNCNAIDTTSKAPHDWNSGAVTTPATCTTAGVKTYTCAVCSATKTEVIPASGHDFVHHEAKAATCTAIGWDAYDTCTRCDYTTYVEKSASGHDLVHHEAKAATCTAIGWDAYDTCRRCDYTTYVEKAALGHDFTVPKYDEIQHWYKCANCTATTEPVAHTDFTAWKSDRSGHWHECSTCGYKTAVNAHIPDRDKATETTPQLCTECGYVIAPATHPVHTWVFVAETPATCNATGVKEHYKCDCRRKSVTDGVYDIVSDTELILAINPANHTGAPDSKWHSDSANHWQEYTCCHARANEAAHSGGAATCTAQAVCQVCGKAYGPLAAHAWQPATCTAPKTCTACHVTDGAALGHDWGAWKVTTPATKDAPGVETRTCTHNSAHIETRSIPKLSTAVYTVSEDTKIAQIEAKVDGLDKILELNENKALVNDGKSVGVSLTVKNTASSGVSEKIKEKLAGSNLVGLRLELTVEKTVTANGVVEPKQTIHDAGVLLKTTITLPAELQGKSGYVVYRLHDENVHVLTETANENGEFISVSADKTQITICARLYSEYVIAYQTGGSSGGGYHPVNPTPVKATSANTGDAGVLLYGVTAALSLTGTAWLGAKSRKH